MQITPVNCNSNGIKKPAFGANAAPVIEDVTNTLFNAKNVRRLREVENMFDEAWTKIKQSKKLRGSQPEFVHKKNSGKIITLKPFYAGLRDQIMLNVENGDSIERLLIPRGNHNSYKYEKIKKTPYGSATVKSFNSNLQKDYSMDLYINDFMDENLLPFFAAERGRRRAELI